MSDLINRDDLYNDMNGKRLELHEKGISWSEFCRGFGFAMEFVKQAPSADPERTAEVEKIEMRNPRNLVYKCKNCGQYTHRTAWGSSVMYCPSCGAKLDWSGNE